MASLESEIVDAGAEIVWVLEQDNLFGDGTAESCMAVMDGLGSDDKGWCVGDDELMPTDSLFDESELAEGRGFDVVVERSSMRIVWVSTHGTPSGNDNEDGADVLAAVQEAVSAAR